MSVWQSVLIQYLNFTQKLRRRALSIIFNCKRIVYVTRRNAAGATFYVCNHILYTV